MHSQNKETTVSSKIKSHLEWLAAVPMLATIGVGVAIGATFGGAGWVLSKMTSKQKTATKAKAA